MYRNLMLTMIIGGLWHGAAWHFVIWGAFHGILLVAHRMTLPLLKKAPVEKLLSTSVGTLARITLTFTLVMVGWLLFRATTMGQVVTMMGNAGFGIGDGTLGRLYRVLFFSGPLLLIQLYQYKKGDLLAPAALHPALRYLLYGLILVWIILFGVDKSIEFIYFQF